MLHDLFLVGGGLFLGSVFTVAWIGIRQRQKDTKTLYDILVAQRGPVLIKELEGGDKISLEDFGYSVYIYEENGELRYCYPDRVNDLDGQFLVKHHKMMLTVLENEQALLRKVKDDRKQRDQKRSQ